MGDNNILTQIKVRFENSDLNELLRCLDHYKYKWVFSQENNNIQDNHNNQNNQNIIGYINKYSTNFDIQINDYSYD